MSANLLPVRRYAALINIMSACRQLESSHRWQTFDEQERATEILEEAARQILSLLPPSR